LIAADARAAVDWMCAAAAVLEIALAAQDEEGHGLVETMAAAEIAIVAIHDDEATGFDDNLIQIQ
jgi:hypothetical protein